MELNFTLETIADAASQFIDAVGNNKVIALHGEMGAGKTTFVHAICNELGVAEPVSSPTYSIINQYTAANGETIYHIDLYRLRDEEEALQAGVEDCLYAGGWCFVEWPQKATAIFPINTLQVTITATEINSRKLLINL
jgi:tRNA threonylcarbamoyladenosine biosynthesis protein TsaE